jgi:hypothetical protein
VNRLLYSVLKIADAVSKPSRKHSIIRHWSPLDNLHYVPEPSVGDISSTLGSFSGTNLSLLLLLIDLIVEVVEYFGPILSVGENELELLMFVIYNSIKFPPSEIIQSYLSPVLMYKQL